jgi:putative transposase
MAHGVVGTKPKSGSLRRRRQQAEIIHRRGPWKTKQAVELATLEWVSWFNHHRLMGPLGNVPPAEFEANYHQQRAGQAATV